MGRFCVHLTDPRTKRDVELLNEDYLRPDIADQLLQLQCGRLTRLLKKLSASQDMLVTDVRRLGPPHPYSGVVPRFYGLPKLHKVGPLQIRPIITNKQLFCDSLLLHLKPILNSLSHG